VVLAIMLGFLVWWRYRNEDLSHVKRATMREVGWALVIAFPAIALPFVIRFAVIEGIATATEVSTIGIAYSVIAGLLIYRQFDWRRLKPMLIETAALSGAILLIIGAATGMAWSLTQSGFSRDLTNAMTGLPGGAPTFLAVSIIAFIVLGSVLEGIPAIVLFGPLLFPIAKQIGVHEVHYSMVVILAMGIFFVLTPFVTRLNREWRPEALIRRAGAGGPVVAGLAFAVAWTPCVGPTLASILAAAGAADRVGHGGVLLAFYALGLAVPFLLTAVAFDRATTTFRWIRDRYLIVTVVSGGVLIFMGVLMITGQLTELNTKAQELLSSLGLNFFSSV